MAELTVLHGCATIQLPGGKNTLVEESDLGLLLGTKWRANRTVRGCLYVTMSTHHKRGGRSLLMHRQIVGEPPGAVVDHHNGDTLDNRRRNLRICPAVKNQQNRRRTWGRSKYKGVTWHAPQSRWQARIQADGKRISLGLFSTEVEAARAYDEAAAKLHGEFACLNTEMLRGDGPAGFLAEPPI